MPNTENVQGNGLGPWAELREWRNAKGFSLSELARESAISKSYLSDLENGRKNPSPRIVARLAVALNVPLARIERRIDINEVAS
jgi:transcriptional regulator with XRE-family HTH domain